jgi:peptidoglycan/LPS O-acetylase OafA/YrhL
MKRLRELDFFRGIAILLVLIWHRNLAEYTIIAALNVLAGVLMTRTIEKSLEMRDRKFLRRTVAVENASMRVITS